MSTALDSRLLNDFQHRFPLSARPFHAVAQELDTDPRVVLNRLSQLHSSGTVSRIGPVFRPNTIGASTLAAMAVSQDAMDEVAAIVNSYREVNHNYEREHHLNLWFVAAAPTHQRLSSVLREIERHTGHKLLSLPLVRDYHIDLGFPLRKLGNDRDRHRTAVRATERPGAKVRPGDELLISAIQQGIPLVERPYRDCGRRVSLTEPAVIAGIESLCRTGIIKRFGVIVRHLELGYRANAMAVWDLPDALADAIGPNLGSRPEVTLCYRRRRHSLDWPYNLFCMIHGKQRDQVSERIEALSREFDLGETPRAILFSTRRFKQRGAIYATPATQSHATHG